MGDDPQTSSQTSSQTAPAEATHTQLRWPPEAQPQLKQVENFKDQYGMTWREVLMFAALAGDQAEEDEVDRLVGEAKRTV